MIDPTAKIHSTAIIEDGAIIGKDVIVGPYSIIGSQVILEDGVILKSHVCIDGNTTIGKNTIVYPFASLGQAPQDLKYEGEDSKTIIGESCTIREYVTIQRGTKGGDMETTVGDNCLFMVGVHVAHDCHVGNNVIMANYVSLGGHVTVGERSVIGGLSAVQQFTRIGNGAMIGGMSAIERDVIPFGTVMGERSHLAGLNLIGLKRAGHPNSKILDLQKRFDELFSCSDIDFNAKIESTLGNIEDNELVKSLRNFLLSDSKRRFCVPQNFKKLNA